jgi:hypothetical protein
MDLMDEELRRVLAGTAEPTRRREEVPPTAAELAAASRPSFRTSSPGRRTQRGGGEALETIGSAVLGSIPAGLAGLGYLGAGQGPEKAADAVQRVQDYLTIDPKTEGGIRAVRGIAEGLSPLGAIPQAAGEATLRATGSPLLATGAELLADPLNLLGAGAAARPAARGVAAAGRGAAKAGKATVQSLGPKAAEMAEAYMRRAGMMPDIFIGKSAKTWDAASNVRAVEMEKAGADPRDIWSQTGNWRAPDGQWRQEISDVEARFTPDPQAKTVAEVLSHPELFRAYPELQSMRMTVDPTGQSSHFAGFGVLPEEITLGRGATKKTALHEAQHPIQEREGFGAGANPDMFEYKFKQTPEQRAAFNAFANLSAKLGGPADLRPSDISLSGDVYEFTQSIIDGLDFNTRLPKSEWEDLRQSAKAAGLEPPKSQEQLWMLGEDVTSALNRETSKAELTPTQQYLRTPGEAEARAVEARAGMTAEQRRATFPEESYDVPISELKDVERQGPTTALATVYHGSPHTFAPEEGAPLGRFRSEKIGTGEGAQAYGVGTYTAEAPEVATGYRERLTGKNPNVFLLGGKDVSIVGGSPEWKTFSDAAKGQGYSQESAALAYQTLKEKKGDLDAASGELTWMDDATKIHDEAASLLRAMQYKPEGGALYTVDLPDPMIEKMLDWDKPLAQQGEIGRSIIEALNAEELLFKAGARNEGRLTGRDAYETFAKFLSPEGASREFQGMGILGIKYLDEGSRAAGQGTRNFVVFPGEEKNLTILQRNEEKLPTKKAQGGPVGGSMSYTQAADVIAGKLVGQGVDPDRAMTMALRMSDAQMKAGGAVLMNEGGDLYEAAERQMRQRRSAQNALFKPEPVRMRKTWSGPLPNRPVVDGRTMVSAEELADFRRQFGAQMTLRDLLNADKGRGPSAANPAARGVQGANIAPRSARVRPDEAATLPAAGAADIPGLIMQGMAQGAERVPAGRGAGAAFVGAGLPRAMTGAKLLREHPSISPERRQMLKEMEDYINGLNKERIEPTFAAGGAAKGAAGAAARAAARAEGRLAEKAAQEAAKKALEAAPPPSLTSAIDQANQMLAQGRSRPYAKPETVRQMMLERAAAISKDAPKLTEQEVASRAQRQVLARLKWERETRPELQKTYGELSPSSYDMPAPRRLRNAPEVVAERAEKAREFLSKPTEPWTPPPPEKQAFDRAMIKEAMEGFPGIEQTRFPRYEAPRAQTDYINEIYDDPANRALIKQQIGRGLPLGGETFYASLYPLKMAALERGIPAEKFDQFVYQTAPASARNSIMNEMAVGQFLRDMNARGLPLDEATVTAEMAKFKQQYGTGLPLMPVHREGVRNVIEGGLNMRDLLKADIPTNYKIPTYGTQKAGDFGKSVVLDVHEAAGQTQGSRFHPYFTEQGGFGPTEYGLAESKMLDIANEMGIPGGTAQAGRWFGGGELTGLKSPRGDALDLLEKQTAYTLQGQGINPTPKAVREYLLDMIDTGRGVLMPYFKGAPMPDVRTVKKEGGEVTRQGALA